MFSMWVYVVVAFAIAGLAFVAAQFAPGAGMIVAMGGSMAWVAYSVARARRHRTNA